MRIVATVLLGLMVGSATGALSQGPTAPPVTAIRAGRMLDVAAGTVVKNPVIVVHGDRIVAAGPNVAVPAGAKVIDLGNALILPGLIDSHTHLLENYRGALGGDDPNMIITVATMSPAKRALLGAMMGREALEAGFTAVRDLGNSGWNGDVALRDAIAAGWVSGPRIYASTRALSAAGGQFGALQAEAQHLVAQEYVVIAGVDDARRAVRQAFYDGADLIKVIVNTGPRVVSADELKVIVEEAHRVGKTVAAHAIGDAETRIAALAGVNSIEHAYRIPDDVLQLMASKGIFLVPTDYPPEGYQALFDMERFSGAERERRIESTKRFATANNERLARAVRLGVRIAAGSDEYYQAGTRTRGETAKLMFRAYRDAGMPPIEIIRAATINGAELLGEAKRMGTVEAGKWADLIAVNGDPLTDITALDSVRFVMKAGAVVRNVP